MLMSFKSITRSKSMLYKGWRKQYFPRFEMAAGWERFVLDPTVKMSAFYNKPLPFKSQEVQQLQSDTGSQDKAAYFGREDEGKADE